jgi:hypothetical protein
MGARRRFAATLAATAALLAIAAPAEASFHEMSIREVYPGGADNASYVELQMWSSGQEFVAGHHLLAYNPNGSVNEDFKFTASVASGANQATVLVADTSYGTVFAGHPAPDASDADLELSPLGGAVCWVEGAPPDCVAWGNFAGPLPAHTPALVVGNPASPAGVPAAMALRRTIAPNCATLLELADDRNDSALDFSLVSPEPRPNSVPPTEHGCAAGGSGGADGATGGGNQNHGAPQTTLFGKPLRATHDRTPTFRFRSSEAGSSFQCRVDRKPFRPCRSPLTARKLAFGRHVFAVRARDASGNLDSSPASCAFRVLRRG